MIGINHIESDLFTGTCTCGKKWPCEEYIKTEIEQLQLEIKESIQTGKGNYIFLTIEDAYRIVKMLDYLKQDNLYMVSRMYDNLEIDTRHELPWWLERIIDPI